MQILESGATKIIWIGAAYLTMTIDDKQHS